LGSRVEGKDLTKAMMLDLRMDLQWDKR